jgi:hypothetical protein
MTTPILTEDTARAVRAALRLVDRTEGTGASPGDYGRLRTLAIALGLSPRDLDDDLGETRLAAIAADYRAEGHPPLATQAALAVIVPRFAIETLVSRGRDAIRDDATIGEVPDADTLAALRAAAAAIGEGTTIDELLAEASPSEPQAP